MIDETTTTEDKFKLISDIRANSVGKIQQGLEYLSCDKQPLEVFDGLLATEIGIHEQWQTLLGYTIHNIDPQAIIDWYRAFSELRAKQIELCMQSNEHSQALILINLQIKDAIGHLQEIAPEYANFTHIHAMNILSMVREKISEHQ